MAHFSEDEPIIQADLWGFKLKFWGSMGGAQIPQHPLAWVNLSPPKEKWNDWAVAWE